MRVLRPSRILRRAATATAYTTGGVERTRVAPAASPPNPSTSSGQALAKNARMGHPPWGRSSAFIGALTGFDLERLRDAKRVYEKTTKGRARDASQELHHAERTGAPQR